MSDEPASDAMVIVAALVSRVEALVVATMLEAAGIQVMVGGSGHASVEVNSLALGGHRLWIPASQHQAASVILREVLGVEPWRFSCGLQRAVLRFAGIWAGISTSIALGAWLVSTAPFVWILAAPLSVLMVPVNPQGRGDYYLAAQPD